MALGSMKLYRVIHTAQRQITTQIPIEFCVLVIGLGLGLGLGHCQSDRAMNRTRCGVNTSEQLSYNGTGDRNQSQVVYKTTLDFLLWSLV